MDNFYFEKILLIIYAFCEKNYLKFIFLFFFLLIFEILPVSLALGGVSNLYCESLSLGVRGQNVDTPIQLYFKIFFGHGILFDYILDLSTRELHLQNQVQSFGAPPATLSCRGYFDTKDKKVF